MQSRRSTHCPEQDDSSNWDGTTTERRLRRLRLMKSGRISGRPEQEEQLEVESDSLLYFKLKRDERQPAAAHAHHHRRRTGHRVENSPIDQQDGRIRRRDDATSYQGGQTPQHASKASDYCSEQDDDINRGRLRQSGAIGSSDVSPPWIKQTTGDDGRITALL